ncbi:MAG: DUF6452 family protein [Bacteroidales bacterium]|nr:DUF6452 family protein [Bacteroidales bacterium]
MKKDSIIVHILYLALFVFIGCVIYQCTDTTDCKYTANRSLKLNFTQLSSNNKLVDTIVSGLTVTTSNGIALYDSVSAKQLQLPLSQLSDTSIFYFYFDSIAIDTMYVFAKRTIEMISPECGFNTRFLLDSAKCSLNNITRIMVVDKNIGENAQTDRNLNLVIKKRPKLGQ